MTPRSWSWGGTILSPPILNIFFWSSIFFLLYTLYQIFWQHKKMAGRAALAAAGAVLCASLVYAQTPTTTSFRAIFTVPSDADNSVPLIPNINDPQAVNAQDVCPGYKASNIVRTPYGLKAQLSLAGAVCNVYGTDIEALNLTVEYQSDDRLHVGITPTYVDSSNSSWYILPEVLVTKPTIDVRMLRFLLTPLLEGRPKEEKLTMSRPTLSSHLLKMISVLFTTMIPRSRSKWLGNQRATYFSIRLALNWFLRTSSSNSPALYPRTTTCTV